MTAHCRPTERFEFGSEAVEVGLFIIACRRATPPRSRAPRSIRAVASASPIAEKEASRILLI
jgi:hypothetical protein